MPETIGFIGLGVMGKPMAQNLLKAGHRLIVHSRSRGPVDELVAAGAPAAGAPSPVSGNAREAAILINRLPDTPGAEVAPAGENGGVSPPHPRAAAVGTSSLAPD